MQGQYSKQALPVISGETMDQQKAVPTGAPRRTYSGAAHKNNGTYSFVAFGLQIIRILYMFFIV